MNLTPFVILWAALGLAVLGLAIYRNIMMFHQDDEVIHLGAGQEELIPQQVALAQKVDAVDKWGKILTILTAVYGLAIAALYVYTEIQRNA